MRVNTAMHPQAPVTALFGNGFSAITSLFFVVDWKVMEFLESENFSTVSVCKFSIFVIITWPLFDTLQGPISANAWSQDSPDQQKAHPQSLGFPSVPLIWGIDIGCEQDSRRVVGVCKILSSLCLGLAVNKPTVKGHARHAVYQTHYH